MMNNNARAAIRLNARTVGVTLQALSAFTFLGTIYATMKVANLGSELGLSGSNDPAPWIVLVTGVFVAMLLAGVGYSLAMLCAIYDRQTPSIPEPDVRSRPTNGSPNSPTATGAWEKLARNESAEPHIQQPPTVEFATEEPTVKPPKETSALWRQLTRERHLPRIRGD
jgi:hypothetical protein